MGMNFVFAGNRDISIRILEFILDQGEKPLALLLPKKESPSDNTLIGLCPFLDSSSIFRGSDIRKPEFQNYLQSLNLDYIFSIHFPHIIPKNILNIPKYGAFNLHPSLLPYNRGWHTPSWTILEKTPCGGTLHKMTEKVDAGPILYQKEVMVLPSETADSLYQRLIETEIQVFKESWPMLKNYSLDLEEQKSSDETIHKKEDLGKIRRLDLESYVKVIDLLDLLRALTTNKLEEGAFFELDGKKYVVQIAIHPVPSDKDMGG